MSWFTDLAGQAIKLADNIAENINQELNKAQQEIEAERNKIKEEKISQSTNADTTGLLPWETDDESRSIISQELMEHILLLSLSENNFTIKPRGFDISEFKFNLFIPTAMRLLALDDNLSKVHSKLMPKMREEDFWCNYYLRIKYLRLKSNIDDSKGYAKVFTFSDEEESTIIYPPDAEAPIASIQDIMIKNTTSADDVKIAKVEVNKDDVASDDEKEEVIANREKRKQQDDELAKEVQAELGDDADLELELGDLDDLDMDDLIDDMNINDQDLLDDILNDEASASNNSPLDKVDDLNNKDNDTSDSDYDKL